MITALVLGASILGLTALADLLHDSEDGHREADIAACMNIGA